MWFVCVKPQSVLLFIVIRALFSKHPPIPRHGYVWCERKLERFLLIKQMNG